MSEAYKKLIKTLQTIFEMDKADLDFGIYRIMNQKRDEINQFLESDLLSQVKKTFADFAEGGKTEVEAELKQLVKTLTDAGVNPEQSPKVNALREKLVSSVDIAAVENNVYSHLHTFFSRYYDKGDFISQRRYKSNTYAIPYEGEEVKLHWANQDQYYIKSSERLRNYAFTLEQDDKRSVHFHLAKADTEKDNVKARNGEERRFVLDCDNPLAVAGGELTIHFHYMPNGKHKQEKLNSNAVNTIFEQEGFDEWLDLLKHKSPTEKNPGRTLLEKHLNDYTARNTFDYFIHKDLGGFLRRELDFYIKNEVFYLDDIDDAAFKITEQHLRKIKVIRIIAHKLIRMLAQLEDFQKKLWLKKKFVVETNYCITLDRVPAGLYGEIAECEAQHAEWVTLFAIDELKGYSSPLSIDFLKANPYIMLDTAFFPDRFKDQLLAEIQVIDLNTNGLLIHSENFQALQLMRPRYTDQVKCIYIDPPYNTAASEILYKNSYKHSSWCSLMQNRILIGKNLLNICGVHITAIDDVEFVLLSQIFDSFFPNYNRNTIVVNHHPAGAGLEGTNISKTHEYAIVMVPYGRRVLFGSPQEEESSEISFMRTGTADSNLRKGRPNSFYAILINPEKSTIVGVEEPPKGNYPIENTADGCLRIYPKSRDGTERVWRRSYESFINESKKENIFCKNSKTVYLRSSNTGKHKPIFSNWVALKKYNAGIYGTNTLRNIFADNLFSYPKSIFTVSDCINFVTRIEKKGIILDYFAGSGTTGHAVVNLNREDGGKRKYIMVEMDDLF